jgi:hypothetical protein
VKEGFDEAWAYDFDHDMYVRLLLAGHQCEHVPIPFAAYRLHAVSKTVAEGHRQIEEFERSAEFYEGQLQGSGRRWCRSTRFLRRSFAASEAGNKREGARWLMRALITYPEGLGHRPFWGCLTQTNHEWNGKQSQMTQAAASKKSSFRTEREFGLIVGGIFMLLSCVVDLSRKISFSVPGNASFGRVAGVFWAGFSARAGAAKQSLDGPGGSSLVCLDPNNSGGGFFWDCDAHRFRQTFIRMGPARSPRPGQRKLLAALFRSAKRPASL